MLVLITAPGAVLPPELAQDVLVLDEPLPSAGELERTVQETFKAADLEEPDQDLLGRAVDALIGLATFQAGFLPWLSIVRRTRASDLPSKARLAVLQDVLDDCQRFLERRS